MDTLMLVEDNEALREQMKWALCGDYAIVEAGSSTEAIDRLKKHQPRIICLDMGLDNVPDKGLGLINEILSHDRRAKIVVATASTDETLGKRAVASGAFDYLRKPIDIDELRIILARAARLNTLQDPHDSFSANGMPSTPDNLMVGESVPMRRIFEMIKKLSQTDVNVLITGESGTGKELCARAIHFHSTRSAQPFVPINCGAIPETLLESELFGYAKGAFTGANSDKKGLIASADKGTLFLDEIGDMPKLLQVKLLRFIEAQTFQRLGDTAFYQSDVRIIAATNKKDIGIEGNDAMRTDLYYRLSGFEIHLPPLRDRGNDVLLLARKIIERNRDKFSLPLLALSQRAAATLTQYSWPGNVRELENKLSRATITCCNQTIEPEDIQIETLSMDKLSLKDAKDIFERNFVINVLRQTRYNISVAARSMGISRPTLYDLLRKHAITITTESKLETAASK